MPALFSGREVELFPGDVLLTRYDWTMPPHWIVAAATRSRLVHATLVTHVTDGRSGLLEWSVGFFGPELRPVALDRECWAYRYLDPGWQEIGAAAARWLVDRLPRDERRYDWEGAGFVGVQALLGIKRRKPWTLTGVPYCFEGITDAYWRIGADLVPEVEPGAVLGADIAASPLLVRL